MGDAQQDIPDSESFRQQSPHEGSMSNMLLDFATANPGMAIVISLGVIWFLLTKLRATSSGVTIGGTTPADREAALEAARQRQQEQLAAAAEARLKAVEPPKDKPASPAAVEPAAAQMPARMKAAMERRLAAERAEARTQQPPAPEVPASSGKKKESLLEKLERIEKGKGSSDFNPLHGKTQTGGAGLTQRKRGG